MYQTVQRHVPEDSNVSSFRNRTDTSPWGISGRDWKLFSKCTQKPKEPPPKICYKQNKTNSVALSPRANYTDWATASCRRNLVSTSVDRGVSRGQRGGSPTVVNLSFLDRSRYFSFKKLLIYPHKGLVDPVPDPLVLRKCDSAGNRTRDLRVSSQEVWTTKPQWPSSPR
jgi:hypothetical protein